MRLKSILLIAIFLIALGCDKKYSGHWMKGSSPGAHDQAVKMILSDPFNDSVLAQTLEVTGLKIEFLEGPPMGGGHFVSLVRTMRDLNRSDESVLASITNNWPEAKYASPDILQISLHTIPDGTPLRDSEALRIRVIHDAARYTLGDSQSGGSGNSTKSITIPNPFYGSYEGVSQYGPNLKSIHRDGITILMSESIEYRIVVNATTPISEHSFEPDAVTTQ